MRLKITWRWNGEKIREEFEPMTDLDMETPDTAKWIPDPRCEECIRITCPYPDSCAGRWNLPSPKPCPPTPKFKWMNRPAHPTWDLNAISEGAKRMRVEQARTDMVLFTNLLHQSLGGEVAVS